MFQKTQSNFYLIIGKYLIYYIDFTLYVSIIDSTNCAVVSIH